MDNKSEMIRPAIHPAAKMIVCAALTMAAMTASLFYTPFWILALTMTLHVIVKYITYNGLDTKVYFWEKALIGSSYVGAAIWMVNSGIPDSHHGLLWLGWSFIALAFGMKSLSDAMKLSRSSVAPAANAVQVVTAKQRTKETKAEESLLNDLTEFLSDLGSDGDKKD